MDAAAGFRLAQALSAGAPVADARFDGLYPAALRRPSAVHWSRVALARRAVALLGAGAGDRVLDVGAGVGKFCLVGALVSRAHFVGVEQRPHLVDAAVAAARALRAGRARFVCADALAVPWTDFTCLYLFNPFEEHLVQRRWRIDGSVEARPSAWVHQAEATARALAGMPPGTRVVVVNGFGARMPPGYTRVVRERCGVGRVELWRRAAKAPAGGPGGRARPARE